jgi:hypothetical protein
MAPFTLPAQESHAVMSCTGQDHHLISAKGTCRHSAKSRYEVQGEDTRYDKLLGQEKLDSRVQQRIIFMR